MNTLGANINGRMWVELGTQLRIRLARPDKMSFRVLWGRLHIATSALETKIAIYTKERLLSDEHSRPDLQQDRPHTR